ncbi:nmrA-like domain containing protein [Rhodotorula toruloides]|uniref:NmrA-like domain containing protein n=1 Tax=Rhodotorula toruloides TaxID=5286 RepID=A0A511KNL4_RHOTO|nr:nmrA-like domain containing protein [Rhodotorula toruloides]
MTALLEYIALYGSSGQVGSAVLDALFAPAVPNDSPKIRSFFQSSDEGKIDSVKDHDRIEKIEVGDFTDAGQKRVDAVVVALNGPALEAQYSILNAAAQAGVERFIPNKFGHHHLYRAPGDDGARMHPYWDVKNRFNESMMLHPATLSGKMTYTIAGTGDFYDQPRETYSYAYVNPDIPDENVMPVVGDPDAKADFTKISDMAHYIAALLSHLSTSANATLNFVSDTLSQREMADLLHTASDKPVELDLVSQEQAHRYIPDPDPAHKRAKQSAFAADF